MFWFHLLYIYYILNTQRTAIISEYYYAFSNYMQIYHNARYIINARVTIDSPRKNHTFFLFDFLSINSIVIKKGL